VAVGCGDSGVVYEEGGEGDLTRQPGLTPHSQRGLAPGFDQIQQRLISHLP
jgi:hypothetical protein